MLRVFLISGALVCLMLSGCVSTLPTVKVGEGQRSITVTGSEKKDKRQKDKARKDKGRDRGQALKKNKERKDKRHGKSTKKKVQRTGTN